MKILITGASGFIGGSLKEYFNGMKDYEVFAPSSRELNCIDEKAVEEYLKSRYFDVIFHCAVHAIDRGGVDDERHMIDYNMRMYLNFAKNHLYYGKMYYMGSGAEYDKRWNIVQATEEEAGKSIPIDDYGLMKYTVGQMIEKSANIYNFRLFGIFGYREDYGSKFISNICCKAIMGMPLSVRQNVYFDYLWIEDFCRMADWCMNNELKYRTYNMVSGARVSLVELCGYVKKICQKELDVFVCREGLGREYTASNRRFLEECPGFAYTPVQKAVEKLYVWYRERAKEIDVYKLLY